MKGSSTVAHSANQRAADSFVQNVPAALPVSKQLLAATHELPASRHASSDELETICQNDIHAIPMQSLR